MEVIFLFSVETMYGYMTMMGLRCDMRRDSNSAYDEVIVVYGKGYSRALVYSTYQSWLVETKTNVYILSTTDHVMTALKEEEII